MRVKEALTAPDGAKEDARTPVPAGKSYLYAIIGVVEPLSYPGLGIDGSDVYSIVEGRVAAVVSGGVNSRVRPQRSNLAAHQAVLKSLMSLTTPLPTAFGTIADNPAAIRKLLIRHQRPIAEQLRRVANKVEMGLRVAWDVPNIFEYFVNVHSELRLARDRIAGARHEVRQDEKIEIGRMFERLLEEDRQGHFQRVERLLTGTCFEIKANPCRREEDVMNLACLVARDAQKDFEACVFEAAKLFDNNFVFDYSGPWAPHNFVELDLEQ